MTASQMLPGGGGVPARHSSSGSRVLGLVLLLPALLFWILYQVLPVVRSLWFSVRSFGFEGEGAFVGLENFSALPSQWMVNVLVMLLLGLIGAAIAVSLGIGLGRLIRRAPIGWQRVALAVVGLGLVTYAPLSMTFALYLPFGLTSGKLGPVAMLPVPLMIGVLAGALASSGRLLLVIGAVTSVGGAAWTLQGETGLVMSMPDASGTFLYTSVFVNFEVGVGAAASTVMGVLLGLLGLGAAIMLLAIRPRFDLTGTSAAAPAAPAAPVSTSGQGRGIVAIVVSAAALLVLVVLALPWLTMLGMSAEGVDAATASQASWHTVGRRVLEAVVTLLVTGAAAVGLGYLRPFGKHSLRALLLFSPWLFVGLVPLITGVYFRIFETATRGEAPFFGITVQMLSVPLLFLLTYLADGVRTARETGRRVPIRSVVGMVVLGIGMVTVVRGQEVVWDIVFLYQQPDSVLIQVVQGQMIMFGGDLPLGLLTPVPALVFGAAVFAAAAALVPGIRLVPAGELTQP